MSLKLIRIHRLKQFQAERNVEGPVELGKLIGRKANQTSDLLNGRAPFGEKVARSIEEFAALPPGWLDQADDDDEGMPAASWGGTALNPSDGVSVTVLATTASKSAGTELRDDVVLGRLILSSSWIERSLGKLSSAKNLRFIDAPDDSMEPTFRSGDVLLVDTGVRECNSDGIYVLRANARLYVRRVRQRMDGTYEISGDSTTVKTADVLNGPRFEVLGRAVWVWNGRKL